MEKIPILDISQFLIPNDEQNLYVNSFSQHFEKNHSHISVPHKHNFYLAVLFTKGRGIHEIDFNAYTITPGCVFLLSPGQTHHWKFTEKAEGYIFFHSQSFYEETYANRRLSNFPFFYSNQNAPCAYLKAEELLLLENLFKTVLQEFSSNHLMKNQKICSLIDLIYIEIFQLSLSGDLKKIALTKNYATKLHKLEQLIDENYIQEKSPNAYANMMHITPKHLNRITKSMLGKTTSDLITERILLEAKRLLIHSQNNFTEIARFLGYEDYAYFSRLFKKKCGQSPSAFQKKYLV